MVKTYNNGASLFQFVCKTRGKYLQCFYSSNRQARIDRLFRVGLRQFISHKKWGREKFAPPDSNPIKILSVHNIGFGDHIAQSLVFF